MVIVLYLSIYKSVLLYHFEGSCQLGSDTDAIESGCPEHPGPEQRAYPNFPIYKEDVKSLRKAVYKNNLEKSRKICNFVLTYGLGNGIITFAG